MRFCHASEIWEEFPQLVPGVVAVDGIRADVSVASRIGKFTSVADDRLSSRSEAELAEIQAWRRTFSQLGLKPTQYRCASESLLRRYRKERALPRIHPLIDLCNAVSLAFADAENRAHARRWTNRQSAYSAVRDGTSAALIVAEAMHSTARADVERLVATVRDELDAVWSARLTAEILTSTSSRFEF